MEKRIFRKMSEQIYFIADTHFGHANIIKYEKRPFASVSEMDKMLIQNWNNVVSESDEIFVLGDFSFYNKEKTKEILQQLNGKKTLIMGNHDTQPLDYYLECGFQDVNKYPIILDGFWILSHEPLYINDCMPYANIYGHVHANKTYTNYTNQSFCACVERIHYTPILFSKIKECMGVL